MKDSVLHIIAPWIGKENEQKKADEDKHSEILGMLKPSEIGVWCSDLRSGTYRHERIITLDIYNEFLRQPNNSFFRRKLKKKYRSMNLSLLRLNLFLDANFFTNWNNPNFVQLYPELKHEDPVRYARLLSTLNELVNDFEREYTKFVVVGREKYVGFASGLVSASVLVIVIVSGILYFNN